MVDRKGFLEKEAWVTQSTLFGANRIYLLAKNITYNQPNDISFNSISKLDVTPTGTETAVGDSVNYNRRKGDNSYDGIGPKTIMVSGEIDLYSLGSIGTGLYTITPGIIQTMMANGHRTYYYYDGYVGSALVYDPDPLGVVQKPYTSTGIPVVLVSSNMTVGNSENLISYQLSFREDKV